jgi:probable phosphoglycerate mutase
MQLSERGKDEIHRLAAALNQRFRLDEIVSSPLERARETAEAIAAVHGKPVLFDDGLLEVDAGEWTGTSFADLLPNEAWKQYNRYRSLNSPPQGEFMLEIQLRAWKALERAIQRQQHEPEPNIAIVSHGDVIRALLLLFLGMPLDFIHRIEISTASVSEVIIGNAYPQVISMNQTF